MEAKTCQYFIKIYGKKNIDVCKWKHMRTNCALTCKICGKILKIIYRAKKKFLHTELTACVLIISRISLSALSLRISDFFPTSMKVDRSRK